MPIPEDSSNNLNLKATDVYSQKKNVVKEKIVDKGDSESVKSESVLTHANKGIGKKEKENKQEEVKDKQKDKIDTKPNDINCFDDNEKIDNVKSKRKRSRSKTKKDPNVNESTLSESTDKKESNQEPKAKEKSKPLNQNPKSKTTHVEIDHSMITDNAELVQKLEETLLLSRSRSRSKSKKSDTDSNINISTKDLKPTKKLSKEFSESKNTNTIDLISKKLSKESEDSKNSF